MKFNKEKLCNKKWWKNEELKLDIVSKWKQFANYGAATRILSPTNAISVFVKFCALISPLSVFSVCTLFQIPNKLGDAMLSYYSLSEAMTMTRGHRWGAARVATVISVEQLATIVILKCNTSNYDCPHSTTYLYAEYTHAKSKKQSTICALLEPLKLRFQSKEKEKRQL